MRRLALLFLVLVGWLPAAAGAQRVGPYEWAGVERVVAIGDVHGSYDKLVRLCRGLELIDETNRWSGGENHLVFVGDLIDRGRNDRAILDLLRSLQPQAEEAGGRVHVLLGNHEVMNLVRDLRYVNPDGYADFAADEDPKERKAAYKKFAKAYKGSADPFEVFQETYPPGYFGRIEALNPKGEYGAWLLEQPVLVKVNGALFVHGGLTEQIAALGVDGINEQVMIELREHLRVRERLEGRSIVTSMMTFTQAQEAVVRFFERNHGFQSQRTWVELAARFGELANSELFSEKGPLWYRGSSVEDERIEGDRLERTLELLDASSIVVAHSPTGEKDITSRFGGRLYRVDHGMSYGSRPLALVLEDHMALVYDPGEMTLAEPRPELPHGEGLYSRMGDLPDERVAQLLASGEVVGVRELGRGSTRPKLVEIRDGETRVRAIFKFVNERPGASLEEGAAIDRYRQEVAAYRLDRLLGLGFVPVTVLRTMDDVEGSMQQWVEDAVDGESMKELGLELPNPRRWERDLASAQVFQYLIGDASHEDSDLLFLLEQNRVMCVDHSRSFPTADVEPGFPDEIDGAFVEALETIDKRSVKAELQELLTDKQIDALLARWEIILAHYRSSSEAAPAWPVKVRRAALSAAGHARAALRNDEPDAADPQSWSDGEKEDFLLNATIVATKYIGEGVTRPKRVTLERNGVTLSAAFKYHDEFRPGVTQFDSGPREVNFRDSYLFDRAAYLLDRELAMGMVPVTVLREVEGQTGALVWWIPDAISEVDRIEQRIMPGDPRRLTRQQDVARVFYALVENTDENLQNQLITTSDWRLYLIDLTRAFRFSRKLGEDVEGRPMTLPREFHQRLQALELDRLLEVMDGLLTKVQLRALLARRDALLEKIENDIETRGERAVFQD